ncbi:unnamed protein product [Sphagnum compactum]
MVTAWILPVTSKEPIRAGNRPPILQKARSSNRHLRASTAASEDLCKGWLPADCYGNRRPFYVDSGQGGARNRKESKSRRFYLEKTPKRLPADHLPRHPLLSSNGSPSRFAVPSVKWIGQLSKPFATVCTGSRADQDKLNNLRRASVKNKLILSLVLRQENRYPRKHFRFSETVSPCKGRIRGDDDHEYGRADGSLRHDEKEMKKTPAKKPAQ